MSPQSKAKLKPLEVKETKVEEIIREPGEDTPPIDTDSSSEASKHSWLDKLKKNSVEAGIGEKLSEMMEEYVTNAKIDKKTRKRGRLPYFTYTEIVNKLNELNIPIPNDEDFALLENEDTGPWDPEGTVVEYFSPMLRSFIPVNMRGRYRGCYGEDKVIQGLDITK